MKRTVNGKTWLRCDSEGFWWLQHNGKDTATSIRRSNENQNRWQLCDGENVAGCFDTMRDAMQAANYEFDV